MSFKDIVAADISNVFLNLEEFGETHELNGSEYTCIVAKDNTAEKNAALLGGRRTPDGLHGDFLTVCLKAADLPRIPRQGENFKVDGKRYTVDSCDESMGMLTLVLGAYRMGGGLL